MRHPLRIAGASALLSVPMLSPLAEAQWALVTRKAVEKIWDTTRSENTGSPGCSVAEVVHRWPGAGRVA
jgi:hypothetical protein